MAAPASNYFGAQLLSYLKTRFPQKEVENVFKFGKPTFEAIGAPKQDLTGLQTVVPMQLGTPQGIGNSIKGAIRSITAGSATAWIVTPADFYAGLTLDAKSLYATTGQEGAFLQAREKETKDLIDAMGQEFEKQLWGTGVPTQALVSVDPGTGTDWTVSTDVDIRKLGKGMRFLVFADSSGVPGAVRAGGPYVIDGINYTARTFTTTAAANAAVAVGDHIVREGDCLEATEGDPSTATVKNVMVGIPGWIPTADPSATTFFNVNRAPYPQVLAGWRGSYLGSIEESAKGLDAVMRPFGRNSKALWLSAKNFNRLEFELGARAIRQDDGGKATFGRPALSMTTASGTLPVKMAPYVPDTHAWLLNMESFSLHSLGPVPHPIKDDGMTAYRIRGGNSASNAEDGIAMEWRAWPQLVCDQPFDNGCFPIS